MLHAVSLLDLPGELQQRVVEHVMTQTDLKSLCMTCTALRVLATPLLYKRIDLRLWSQRAVESLRRCNLAGAGLNFQYTKELIVEDEPAGEELKSIHTGRIRLPVPDRGPWNRYLTESQQDDSAYSFLQIMHHDKLERLCYHSRRPLSPMVKAHLSKYQNKLKDLQISLYTDPRSPELLPQIFCGLQRLDLYLTESTNIALLFDNIEAVGANLSRLSLTAANPRTTEMQLHVWAMGETNDLTRYTPRLEELRLSKLDFSDTFEQLSRTIDFHRLVRLEPLVESCSAHLFLKDLANSIYARSAKGDRLQLKHIAVDLVHDLCEREAIDLRNSMELIIMACGPLETFHMRYPEANPIKITLLDFLQALSLSKHNLQSLSIYCDEFETLQWDEAASDLLQWVSVSSLSRVKQLAVYFGESAMLDGYMAGNYPIILESLARFPQLRLLHLHVPDCDRLGKSGHHFTAEWDSSILALQLQTFANQLFGDLHEAHSKLDALVIGHLATVEAILTDEDIVIPLPQQCFVKGEQRDILGRTVAVGVPVTRTTLRATQPYTDILDIDHTRTHDSYDAWADKEM